MNYNKGRNEYGGIIMRRCVLLVSGLLAGFFVLWALFMQMITTYVSGNPVVSLINVSDLTAEQHLQFPFPISGTTLIAEQIVSYEGLFLEGEEPCFVTDVAALLLYNYGKQGILDAKICLRAGQVQYTFVADMIPAGARILVPDQNAMQFGPKEFTACSGSQREDKSDWSLDHILLLEYPQMGEVVVTNQTDDTLTGISLYYKTYYADWDFYVGGKTQIFFVEELNAGENIRIYPNNYAYGYSRFLGFKTDMQIKTQGNQ